MAGAQHECGGGSAENRAGLQSHSFGNCFSGTFHAGDSEKQAACCGSFQGQDVAPTPQAPDTYLLGAEQTLEVRSPGCILSGEGLARVAPDEKFQRACWGGKLRQGFCCLNRTRLPGANAQWVKGVLSVQVCLERKTLGRSHAQLFTGSYGAFITPRAPGPVSTGSPTPNLSSPSDPSPPDQLLPTPRSSTCQARRSHSFLLPFWSSPVGAGLATAGWRGLGAHSRLFPSPAPLATSHTQGRHSSVLRASSGNTGAQKLELSSQALRCRLEGDGPRLGGSAAASAENRNCSPRSILPLSCSGLPGLGPKSLGFGC